MYNEKMFRIILPTTYFKVIEIGEESLMYIITINNNKENLFKRPRRAQMILRVLYIYNLKKTNF